MSALHRAIGAALAGAALFAMAWASRLPLEVASGDSAVVRISLGARPERIEQCTTQTDEALAKVAPQMRQRVVCEGVTARYLLELHRDGDSLFTVVVRGGGLRNDRQLYVFQEIAVPAGRSSLRLRLTRVDSSATSATSERDEMSEHERAEGRGGDSDFLQDRGARERDERRWRRQEAVPPDLELELDATLVAREVLLLTYDAESRSLRAVRASDPPPDRR